MELVPGAEERGNHQVPDQTDRQERALEIACSYLNRRERTVAEVRRHLERGGVDEAGIEEAVLVLCDQGYLDDARFAGLFAQDKRALEHWGSARIERGLVARGIDRELARAALAEAASETELERALALLSQRFPTAPQDRRDRERALGVLLRKGYDSELALDALAAYSRG